MNHTVKQVQYVKLCIQAHKKNRIPEDTVFFILDFSAQILLMHLDLYW